MKFGTLVDLNKILRMQKFFLKNSNYFLSYDVLKKRYFCFIAHAYNFLKSLVFLSVVIEDC